jgi:hypothetical protein
MRKIFLLLSTTALLGTAAYQPANADDWHGHGDFHGFHDHNFDHWRGGHWFNGPHDGRGGWWWVVDGMWYFYPAPVYPYPDPNKPPTIVVETAPGTPHASYYCANPPGYYPSVPQCALAWQKVVTPAAPPPQVIVTQTAQPVPSAALPPVVTPAGGQHDIDLQQLNLFAAILHGISPYDRHARTKLKNLDKQVESFRQSLFARDYNAMDVLKDAEDLKKRISTQKNALAQHSGTTPAAGAAPVPAPMPLSPGLPPPPPQ